MMIARCVKNCGVSIVILISFVLWPQLSYALPEEIKFGGLFETSEKLARIAFQDAVNYVNNDPTTLRDSILQAKIEDVPQYDSFTVGKTVCSMLEEGMAGILGPQSRDTWHLVQSLCDTVEIPHIETIWDHAQRRGSCLVNMFPHPFTLARAFAEIVLAWNWQGFTIIYDDDYGLMRMSELLKIADARGYMVSVRQLNISDPESNYRHMLREVKAAGEKNIVVECSLERLHDVLLQAQQVGLMGSTYSYIITSLDFQTIDVDPFKWSGTNITGIRMIDPEDRNVVQVISAWTEKLEKTTRESYTGLSLHLMGPALIHDAVLLYSKALDYLDRTLDVEIKPIHCESHTSWEHGYSIINYMKMSELEGLSGLIKFDHQGFRTDVKLDIIELSEEGLQKKGSWNSTTGLAMDPYILPAPTEGADLRNMTFIVLIALTAPYGMLKESSNKLEGNERFEGFGIDLIHELSQMSGFNYTFKVQEDGSSGNPLNDSDKNSKWNGMIGEVMEGRADLAIADITITMKRVEVIDFTMPFMNLGISILHRRPTTQPPSLFSFLSPFSPEVWVYMMSAYLGVSLLLFFMARISPYEWRNPYPCIEEPENLENQFTLTNSFWFTMGSLMQQGSDIAPISVSTRMVAAIWWFFTLIMVSSYTANLAAFLTIEPTVSPFKDVKELEAQNVIRYGAKSGGSTEIFFKESLIDTYRRMYSKMSANPDWMVKSNDEGVQRVLRDPNYAFFMESSSIQYEIERQCQLAQINGLLDNKGYGIVMRKNSSYRDALITNVVNLQEKGKLKQLENKWWKEKRGGGACQETTSSEAKELDLDNVGGVFVVMVAGLVFAIVVAIGEALCHINMNENKVSFKEDFKEHVRFVMKCHGTTKPAKPSRSSSSRENSTNNSASYGFKPDEEGGTPTPPQPQRPIGFQVNR